MAGPTHKWDKLPSLKGWFSFAGDVEIVPWWSSIGDAVKVDSYTEQRIELDYLQGSKLSLLPNLFYMIL